MNNFSKLIKSKLVSFNQSLLESYKTLNLDETDAMILMHLHAQIRNGSNILSISSIASKMSIDEDNLSNRVLSLVQRGFLELSINNSNQESFSIEETYCKIGNVIDDEVHDIPKSRKDTIREIVNYIETTFQTALRPTDVEIINAWFDERYTMEEIQEAVIYCLNNGKRQVKFVDQKLVSIATKEYSSVVDEKTERLIKSIYVKHSR